MSSRHYNSDPHWKGRSYKKGGQHIGVLRERVRARREQDALRRAALSPPGKLARIQAIYAEWAGPNGDSERAMWDLGLALLEPDPRCPVEQIRLDARRHWMVKDGAESPAADEMQRMLEEMWLAGLHSK
jgi:hypothetical protein